mmetsp:Transcript_22650/g.54690  ORF Transcript_22650/g.54690 Transcript_22650/m.54690 type:complete len:306 (-) Transcript_22650:216-1133(-)
MAMSMRVSSSTNIRGHRQRTNTFVPIMRTAVLAFLLYFSPTSIRAFQAQSPPSSSLYPSYRHPHNIANTHHRLHAKKPSNKSKSKSGGGFGSNNSNGGFGSAKKKAAAAPADPSKVRSVSGYTGSGTKVLASAANNFDRIRKLFGKDVTTDVYVRSPLNDESVFWFVGKVIRMVEKGTGSGVDTTDDDTMLAGAVHPTESEAILSQKRLILEYAKNQLRPQNMGGPYSKNLELWLAPGDSEMDVVQNKVTLVAVEGSSRDLREGFNVNDVGYNPEIYVGEEKEKGGLRVVRDGDGRPVKPVFEIS